MSFTDVVPLPDLNQLAPQLGFLIPIQDPASGSLCYCTVGQLASLIGGGGGLPTVQMMAAQTIFPGAFVNIFSNSGVMSMQLADATNINKIANGFCLAGAAVGTLGAVSFPGADNTAVTVGSAAQETWLSVTIPGSFQLTAPSTPGVGQYAQSLGPAMTGGSGINFQPGAPVPL